MIDKLDLAEVQAALDRAAHKGVHGTREERSGKFFIPCSPDDISYTIGTDGLSITFHPCGRTSHNRNDVANKYCGGCHRSMDLLEAVREMKKERFP